MGVVFFDLHLTYVLFGCALCNLFFDDLRSTLQTFWWLYTLIGFTTGRRTATDTATGGRGGTAADEAWGNEEEAKKEVGVHDLVWLISFI